MALGDSLPAAIAEATTGTTYYVATTGSDSNPGTQGSPWKTLGKAWTTMAAGDKCFIRGGTYRENLTKAKTGTSSGTFTFSNFPGEQVIWKWLYCQTTGGSQAANAGTLNVDDTTDFANSGSFKVYDDSVRPSLMTISYTGKTATTFTGCTGGT